MKQTVVLVHDISAPHPRLKYLDAMAAEVAQRTGDALTISSNPGGKVLYAGRALLDAVLSGKVPMALVNSGSLGLIDPRLGFTSLPFTITDEAMTKPGAIEGVMRLMQSYTEPKKIRILSLMRGADTFFVFREKQIRKLEDLKGVRIRVAAPGLHEELMNSLGAKPVAIPGGGAFVVAVERGEVDGIITSPGGWQKVVSFAPKGSHAPGLIFYTLAFIADQAWLHALPAEQRQALIDAARTWVAGKWQEMKEDDAQLISDIVAGGASFESLPANQLTAWKKQVEGVVKKFSDAFPEVLRQYRAIVQ